MAIMSLEEIKTLLPQRYPFLLIDRVVDLDLENKSIYCYKNVSNNEDFFNGHFPGYPVMPGVLIIESMAQAAGILGFKIAGKVRGDRSVYYFAGADGIKFKQPVVPGDRLDLEAHFLKERKDIWKFSCQAKVSGKVVSIAEITCAKRDIEP